MTIGSVTWTGPTTVTLTSSTFAVWTRGQRQDDDPPPAGVREPRRPRGGPPSGAVALTVPG